jgi:hypothetical protein
MGTYPDAAVERPLVPAGGNRAFGVGVLLERQILCEAHVEEQLRLIALQPIEVHPGELG